MPTIRQATAADARRIAEVSVGSWRVAYHGLMPAEILDALSIDDREASWRSWLTPVDVRAQTWVVSSSGEIVGFVSTGPSRDADARAASTAELFAMYLTGESWGSGLGRLLFAHATRALASLQFTTMTLWVLDGNARARGFYEHMNMRPDGAIKTESLGATALPHTRYRLALLR